MKYNKYRIKPITNDIITIVFENVECAYILKTKCKFRVSGKYIKKLNLNLDDIKYGSFYEPTKDRIVKYHDICWVEINNKRYWAKWDESDIYGWNSENEYQVNNINKNKVYIEWVY